MLISNTQHTGAGLVMLGGDRSFGNGGWQDTELEKAMPLDFTIKNAKVVPKGAVALIMHASETGNGNHWMKLTAKAAIEALGAQDYCGLLSWNNTEQWLWSQGGRGMIPVGDNRDLMLRRLNAMAPGRHARLCPHDADGPARIRPHQGRLEQAADHHQRRRPGRAAAAA